MKRLMLLSILLWPLAALADNGAPFLWQIKGPLATHYLLGSVHMLPAESQPLPTALETAYKNAKGLVFETDLAALSEPKTQMQMLTTASAPQGIKSLIGKSLYQKLAQQTAALQMPMESSCEHYRPWFCAMTLEVMSFERAGFKPQYGLDQVFYTRAREDGKTINGLETPVAHLKLFTDMSDKLATEFLSVTLDELSDPQQSPQEMFRMWRDNDVAALEKITLAMKAEQPRAYLRLLSGRSRAWMDNLRTPLASADSQLIVVGAAHTAGPDGLLVLLKQAGFEVMAVPSEASVPPATAPSAEPQVPATPINK